MSTTARVSHILERLSDDQRAAVAAPRGPVAIVAGAGTGKTTTMTARIARLVTAGDVPAKGVLAVTHSRKAAAEMRHRLARVGVEVSVRTFHAAALAQLRQSAASFGLTDPRLIDSKYPTIRRILEGRIAGDVTADLVFDVTSEVGWAQVRCLDAATYPAAAAASGRTPPLSVEQIAEICNAYREAKANSGVLDFEDLLEVAANQLDDVEAVGAAVRGRYECFVVDEYQDTDPLQQKLLDAWLGGRDDISVVGDPRQAIYGFKGADVELLSGFADRYPRAVTVSLVENHRSTPQITTLANKVMTVAGADLVGLRAPGPDPKVVAGADERDEEQQLVTWIRGQVAAGTRLEEIAVLYRFNATAARIEACLAQAGIPHRSGDAEGRFFERAEVLEVLRPFGQAARSTPDADGLELLTDVAADAGFDPDLPPTSMGRLRDRWEAQRALLDVARTAATVAGSTAGALLAALLDRAREQHDPSIGGSVTVSTLHKAKGLEWDAVWIVGVTDGALPSLYATTPAQMSEERRLLYVGVTRPRRDLVLSWPRKREISGGRTMSCTPSPFLTSLQLAGSSAATAKRQPRSATQRPAELPTGAFCRECKGRLRGATQRSTGVCSSCT